MFSGNCTSGLKVLCCYRIALQEETNRMSANALAIVFAPCILRCPDSIDPLQSVQDISKTTAYVHKLTLQFYSRYSLNARNLVYCCNYSLITSKCNRIFGLMSTKKLQPLTFWKGGFQEKQASPYPSVSKSIIGYQSISALFASNLNGSLVRRCVELIINEQMSKYKARLKDISSLEFAENKAKSRLTHIRRSMVRSKCSRC